MQSRSLGYRTDLIFHRFEGDVTDRGRYLVVRTPRNPTYRWGNFLLFDAPPGPGDFERWTALFEREVGRPPEVTHKVFGWDAAGEGEGDIEPFLAAGYALETSAVMATSTLKLPQKYNHDVKIRALTEADYAAVVDLHVLSGYEGESEADYRPFWEANMRGFGRMVRAGRGAWFGAFLDGELVADMGIFTDGELARYQAVVTHPEYRRRGICGTLLYEVGRYALRRGARTLVIVADDAYFAKNIYASVGFTPKERQLGLEWVLREG